MQPPEIGQSEVRIVSRMLCLETHQGTAPLQYLGESY